MNKWIQYITISLLIVIFAYTGIRFVHTKHTVKAGEQAPSFELESIFGDKVNLAQYKGKPVVLNFFTTWCGPCIDELPELEAYNKKYGAEAPLLIIDRREPKERVTAFAQDHRSSLLYLFDYRDDVSSRYGIQGQPETMIVDANGIVQRYIVGGMTADDLAKEVREHTQTVNKP